MNREDIELVRMYVLHYNITEYQAIDYICIKIHPEDIPKRNEYKNKLIDLCKYNNL